MHIYTAASQLVGRTPLLRLPYAPNVLAKLELFNPAGSAKDRVALELLRDAEERGLLRPGGTVIEPTSGNTGIGLAALAAQRGYRCVIVMPDSMSPERQKLMRAYGAELVLTPGSLGMQGAIDRARELADRTGGYIPDQFANPANALAHYRTTGPEIWEDTGGTVDIFVAGVGTGGTVTGVGRYLKERNPAVQVAAVEPAASPLLSAGRAGSHGIQGIGANFVPEVLDRSVYDRVIPVTEQQAFAAARELGRRAGILAGISSGAALHGALLLAREQPEKTVVVLLPDTGERYLSTELFGE